MANYVCMYIIRQTSFWQISTVVHVVSCIRVFLIWTLANGDLQEGTSVKLLVIYWVIYIIAHYNPSARIIDLVSHKTYVVCVNVIYKWRDLQFKVDSKKTWFWETFHGNIYLLSEFLSESCWKEIAEELLLVFWFDVWPGARTLALRLISQHNYGDFSWFCQITVDELGEQALELLATGS